MNLVAAGIVCLWILSVEIRMLAVVNDLTKLKKAHPFIFTDQLDNDEKVLKISNDQKDELMKLIEKFEDEEDEDE